MFGLEMRNAQRSVTLCVCTLLPSIYRAARETTQDTAAPCLDASSAQEGTNLPTYIAPDPQPGPEPPIRLSGQRPQAPAGQGAPAARLTPGPAAPHAPHPAPARRPLPTCAWAPPGSRCPPLPRLPAAAPGSGRKPAALLGPARPRAEARRFRSSRR